MNRRSFLASGLTIAEWRGLDAAWANAVEFYVGRNGRDENPGDKRKPFATIVRARNEVRKLIANGLKANATVWIGSCTYMLRDPLIVGPEDSGTDQRC